MMRTIIVLQIKEPDQSKPLGYISEKTKLIHFTNQEVLSFDGEKLIPISTTNPPPVKVKGPFVPGDIKGYTYEADNVEDAVCFVKHVQGSGLVEDWWLEQEN